jgi:hypothetical protein
LLVASTIALDGRLAVSGLAATVSVPEIGLPDAAITVGAGIAVPPTVSAAGPASFSRMTVAACRYPPIPGAGFSPYDWNSEAT